MTYDEALAGRMRQILRGTSGLAERRMFGGLAFLVDGQMAVVASGKGGIMVRVDPAASDELVATTAARFAEMGGREISGWLRLDAGDVPTDRELVGWITMGVEHVRSRSPA
jgi:hypothetical protein